MTKILTHWDCDGAISGILASYHYPAPKVEILTKEFGDVSDLT